LNNAGLNCSYTLRTKWLDRVLKLQQIIGRHSALESLVDEWVNRPRDARMWEVTRSRSLPLFTGMMILALSTASAAGGNNRSPLGKAQLSVGDFPGRADQYLLDDQNSLFPYRLEFSLSGTATNQNWQIIISSETRSLTVNSTSVAAGDGTFLSPVLDVRGSSMAVSLGAPTVHVTERIVGKDFGRALSVYPDATGGPEFLKVADAVAAGGTSQITADRLRRAAQGMGWLGIEDHRSGEFDGCTAFLIAGDLLLTAGHCIGADSVSQSSSVLRAWIRELTATRELAPTFDRVTVAWTGADAGLDALLLRLPFPAPKQYALKLDETPPTMGPVQILQFPGQDELSIAANNGCKIRALVQSPALLMHTCNSERGSSGSPVLDASLTRGVLGLHVEGYTYDPSEESKAIPILVILENIKTSNPALYREIHDAQGELKW
jgi:hypothetical protein